MGSNSGPRRRGALSRLLRALDRALHHRAVAGRDLRLPGLALRDGWREIARPESHRVHLN